MKFSPGDFFSKNEHTHILACFRLCFNSNQYLNAMPQDTPKWLNPFMHNIPKWSDIL